MSLPSAKAPASASFGPGSAPMTSEWASGDATKTGRPVNAVALALFAISLFAHARMGLQVVIEDYVHHRPAELALQVLVLFACRTPRDDRVGWRLPAEFSVIFLGMLLFSERTWKHHAVTLLLPWAAPAASGPPSRVPGTSGGSASPPCSSPC